MTKDGAKNIGDSLINLADLLTNFDDEVTADEILGNISGVLISEEDAGLISDYLSSNTP